jgi:hypothetical protein
MEEQDKPNAPDVEAPAPERSEADEKPQQSEKAPLVSSKAKKEDDVPLDIRLAWWLASASVVVGSFLAYKVHIGFPASSSRMSRAYIAATLVSWALSISTVVVAVATNGKLPVPMKKKSNAIYAAYGFLLVPILLSGEVPLATISKGGAWLGCTAIMAAGAIGVISTLTKDTAALYGYVVFWFLSLVGFGTVVYYLDSYANNTHVNMWKPRLTSTWEKTVAYAPELICSVESSYECSGFSSTCLFWPKVADRLPNKVQRPQCAPCKQRSAKRCQSAIQKSLLSREGSLLTQAGVVGVAMFSLMASGVFTLFSIMRRKVTQSQDPGMEKALKDAEPIVQELLACRLAMTQLTNEVNAGRAPHQEAFTKVILKLDAIDVTSLEDGPIKERIRMARKQNIEYMEDLSQRALALRDGDGTLTEADEPGAPAEENAAVATDSPAAENAEPGYAEPKDEDDAAEPQEDTTGAGAPESAAQDTPSEQNPAEPQ